MSTHNTEISPNRQKQLKASLFGLAFLWVMSCGPQLPVWFNQDANTKTEFTYPSKIYAEEELKEVYLIVEDQASYPGGLSAWTRYFQENIIYPKEAIENKVEGMVILSFVVKKDGSLCNVNIKRGIGYGCDEEAVRILLNSGNWNPGKEQKEPVHSRMNFAIPFKLK